MGELIQFCFIVDFPSLKEGIFALSPITKSSLKKAGLSKNYLNKRVIKGDLVEIPLSVLNFGKINPIYQGVSPKIIFEDENFLLLSKPQKIHSHPLGYGESDNLLSFISSYNSKLLEVNRTNYDRGLIYRLDYETSGLIYYAKTDTIYTDMRTQFNSLMKQKNYLAIIDGQIEQTSAVHFLKTGEKKGSRVFESEQGRECLINIKELKYNKDLNQSLVSVNLKQGFKHQIRVQLALLGHPILGDPLYSNQSLKADQRMWLHCYQYYFEYDGKTYNAKDNSSESELFFTYFDR